MYGDFNNLGRYYANRFSVSVFIPDSHILDGHAISGAHMLLFILTVVLIIALIGSVPKWPHSRSWGYYPSGGVGLILVILLVLYLLGRL
jgi:Protein of unknown function (DUF3309)